MLPRPCFIPSTPPHLLVLRAGRMARSTWVARGSPGGGFVVLVCFDGQERASRLGEADILMDKPLTRTEPGLDDTLSSVLLLPVSFAFSHRWGM